MTRVLATLLAKQSTGLRSWLDNGSFVVDDDIRSLTEILESMLECMIAQSRDVHSGLLRNYLDGEKHQSAAWAFGDAAGTSLVTAAVYRLAVLLPEAFMKRGYLLWADQNIQAVAKHVHEDGRVGPVAQINGVPSTKAVEATSEGQSMALLLYAARRDFVEFQRWLSWLRSRR